MIVKIKRLIKDAVIPSYSKAGDAGLDITAISDGEYNPIEKNYTYHTGIAVDIPEGYVGLIFPRSSLSKKDLFLTNSVGVIDHGYTGEILFKFKEVINKSGSSESKKYSKGDRIGQLIILPIPRIEFEEVEELPTYERGSSGFGSTGN